MHLSEVYLNKNYSNQTIYHYFPPFADSDLNRVFKLPATTLIGGKDSALPLKEISARLENVYCRSIGVEYMFINSFEQRHWVRERIEVLDKIVLDKNEKLSMLARLGKATWFESFLVHKWLSEKRFGLEGCEILIPILNEIVDLWCQFIYHWCTTPW